MKNVVLAGGLGLVLSILSTRAFIGLLVRQGYGQFIRDDGPKSHQVKRGTPTMGGVAIVFSVVVAYFLAKLITWTPPTATGLLLIGLMVMCALLGFVDDFTKITKQRSLGLTAKGKMLGQAIVGGVFGFLVLQFPNAHGITPGSAKISLVRDIDWLKLPIIVAIIWIALIIIGTTNAVNLTDGLDGLAAGSATMVFAAYSLISVWQFNQSCHGTQRQIEGMCYLARNPLDLAAVAMALAGACFGFLWWNAKPAKIFMGDTGSLALGAAIAGCAVLTRTELLLVILGGLFVIETMSDVIQIGYFKLTKGKRVFKMAPLHHHFELVGWSETTVVIRFWIICGLCVAAAISLFYGEWLSTL